MTISSVGCDSKPRVYIDQYIILSIVTTQFKGLVSWTLTQLMSAIKIFFVIKYLSVIK